MKRKNDPEVLRSALSAIRNKYEYTGVSVDDKELATALITAAPKEFM